ncbi:tryptophan-rich protein [Plasmodium ovale]|uniref:Tryptophan-rich antigen n=2 Tax=Plasmodium ovale TaxID=36330 RepID=A0A1A8WHJ4_PLAOA|nr:tryptophan-rich antigen [Plasmodium ovale curtisi]SBT02210.1 tryptophan-rich antigen [Plasmodium ovale curtisi]SBT84614.1 tryptophan-rich protein [Plasmodium ovale]
MVSTVSVGLLVLASVLLNSSSVQAAQKIRIDTTSRPILRSEPEELWRTKSKEWKVNEWKMWLKKTDGEFKQFHASLEEVKKNWIKENGTGVKEFIDLTGKKWLNFNEAVDREYKSNVLKKSASWKEAQWKEWLTKEGKKLLEKDWQLWIAQKESLLNALISVKWDPWKVSKIQEWKTIGWKFKEDMHWIRNTFYMPEIDNSPQNKEYKDQCNEWKQRDKMETDQWNKWITEVEKKHVNKDCPEWAKWKKDKTAIFDKWATTFIHTLIKDKQWIKWKK